MYISAYFSKIYTGTEVLSHKIYISATVLDTAKWFHNAYSNLHSYEIVHDSADWTTSFSTLFIVKIFNLSQTIKW